MFLIITQPSPAPPLLRIYVTSISILHHAASFRRVKRFARILLIIAAAVLVLITAGGWVANRWLQSRQGRAFVEGKLAKALALPVKYEKIRFSAWRGLTAEGIAMPEKDGNFLEAAAISVKQDFASLL